MSKNYRLECGTMQFSYRFLYPDTLRFFVPYMKETDEEGIPDFHLNNSYLEECRWLIDENEESLSFLEYQSLMIATGNELLKHDRCLFHSAALLWKEKAWLLCAPSGTGKTTQLRHWKTLLKKDVKVINGDKPLLECKEDGSVWVYSSPWKGKERYGIKGLKAPLGGIIYLKQDEDNHIQKMTIQETVKPLFSSFISYPETEEEILHQAEILKKILSAVPVWKLYNKGDLSSAKLTIDMLERYMEERI